MGPFLPSPQQILVLLVERGETVLPFAIVFAVAGLVWAWRRRRRGIRFGAGALFALMALISVAGTFFAHTVRGDLRRRTLDLRFETLGDARAHRVADWKGQVVVVNYWATWCEPCRRELPDLGRFAHDFRGRGVTVITLTNEAPETVRKWGDPALRQTVQGVFTDTPAGGFAGVVLGWRPVTLVLDRSSAVRSVLLGAQDYATLEKEVREAG
jgi:thiol-disulfide isomerase/thioredoxin